MKAHLEGYEILSRLAKKEYGIDLKKLRGKVISEQRGGAETRGILTVSILCEYWGYSRQVYYKEFCCLKEDYHVNNQVLPVVEAIGLRKLRVGGLKL